METIDLILIVIVILYLYLLLFKLPFYPFYYESDQLIFMENADRMLHGQLMYYDFFQFTFPGGQVLYYSLFSIFGTQFWLAGFAAIIAGAGSFYVCLRISKHLIKGPLGYLPAVVYAFFGLRWFGMDGSHRVFSPLFIWVAILVLIKWPRSYLLAGVLCSFSSFFTQNRGAVAFAAFSLFILIDNIAVRRGWKEIARDALSLASGYLVSLLVLCGYFLASAGISTFVWSTFAYPVIFYRHFKQNNYGVYLANLQRSFSADATFLEFLPAIFYSLLPSILALFLFVFIRGRAWRDWNLWRGPVLLAVVDAILVLLTIGPSYMRFFHISIPLLILLFWLPTYLQFFEKRQKQAAVFVSALLIISSALIAVRFQSRTDYVEINAPRGKVFAVPAASTDRYLWLIGRTKPGDYALEVYPSYVYFLLGLRSASRFSQFLPTEYTRPEFVAGAVEDLESTRPRYIVWNNSYLKPVEQREPDDNLAPLADHIEEHYGPIGPIFELGGERMQIWERTLIQD